MPSRFFMCDGSALFLELQECTKLHDSVNNVQVLYG